MFTSDTFTLQQVSDGVPECVQVGANLPDIHTCWSRVQWNIV